MTFGRLLRHQPQSRRRGARPGARPRAEGATRGSVNAVVEAVGTLGREHGRHGRFGPLRGRHRGGEQEGGQSYVAPSGPTVAFLQSGGQRLAARDSFVR